MSFLEAVGFGFIALISVLGFGVTVRWFWMGFQKDARRVKGAENTVQTWIPGIKVDE